MEGNYVFITCEENLPEYYGPTNFKWYTIEGEDDLREVVQDERVFIDAKGKLLSLVYPNQYTGMPYFWISLLLAWMCLCGCCTHSSVRCCKFMSKSKCGLVITILEIQTPLLKETTYSVRTGCSTPQLSKAKCR